MIGGNPPRNAPALRAGAGIFSRVSILFWHGWRFIDMSAIGWVMIANSSNCVISPGWLASIAEGDSIINATLCKSCESTGYLML